MAPHADLRDVEAVATQLVDDCGVADHVDRQPELVLPLVDLRLREAA
jgi:hypothetical protein